MGAPGTHQDGGTGRSAPVPTSRNSLTTRVAEGRPAH
jgi:hypothetical protein